MPCLLQGESYSGQPGESGKAIRAFNEAVVKDTNVNVVVLPVRDGISLITRKQNATSDRYSLTGQVHLSTSSVRHIICGHLSISKGVKILLPS